MKPENKWLALLLLGNSILFSVAYFALATVFPIYIPYLVIGAVMTLAFVIYNRGFSRKSITPEMLPDSWSAEKKTEFIEDGKYRLMKSKPLLILVIAFFFTFAAEAVELIVIPFFADFFGA